MQITSFPNLKEEDRVTAKQLLSNNDGRALAAFLQRVARPMAAAMPADGGKEASAVSRAAATLAKLPMPAFARLASHKPPVQPQKRKGQQPGDVALAKIPPIK